MFKSQIPNHKSQTNSNSQFPKFQTKKFWILVIWSLVIVCDLVLGYWNLDCLYAQDAKEEEALFVAKKAFEDGFWEVTLSLLERFLKNYPASEKIPEVNLLMGECYFHQNKFLDALGKFEELANAPSALKIKDAVLYWIAEVHFRGNAFNKATQYYKMLIDEFPQSSYLPSAYYSLGWCLFQESRFNEALEYFKFVEEKFPQEPQFQQDSSFRIIECLYNLKNYNTLKDKIGVYLKLYPKDTNRLPYLYFYSAEANYYLNNFAAAMDAYTKVISRAQDDKILALSKLGMGWVYLKLKRYKEAQDTFSGIKTDTLEKRGVDILWLGKAILCSETSRFSQAKDIYNELLDTTSDPLTLLQAYLGKADAFYNLAEYKEAINVYKTALDKITAQEGPQGDIVDKLHCGLSWAYLKEGEFKEAIDEFQKLVSHTEDKIVKLSALCQIGDAHQDSGDYNKAIETYDAILKDYPDSLYSDYVQYQLGLTLVKTGNFAGAIAALKTVKKNFPNSKLLDDTTYALGLAYFQNQDYASSREIFERFQIDFKDSGLRPQAMYLLGANLYNLGKFGEAIGVFKDIIRMYNQDSELLQKAEYEIADCYYQMGNEKEAMTRFKVLRAKYPDSKLTAEVMWWLGEYYYRHEDLNLARRYFSSLIQDFPTSNLVPSAYYTLGSTFVKESKYPEAIENFKLVMALDNSDLAGTAAIALADIYIKLDQLDLALVTYQDVAQKHANLIHLTYPKMADIYRKTNDYEKAMNLYYKSLEVVPVGQMADIQFKLAEMKEQAGKAQEAIEEYLKVTYLYPENNNLAVRALLRIAQLYEDKDNFKEATNIYKRIVAMDVQEAKYAQERIDYIKTQIK